MRNLKRNLLVKILICSIPGKSGRIEKHGAIEAENSAAQTENLLPALDRWRYKS